VRLFLTHARGNALKGCMPATVSSVLNPGKVKLLDQVRDVMRLEGLTRLKVRTGLILSLQFNPDDLG
jgi:hypothetical protein